MAFVTEDNLTDLALKRWSTAHSPRLAELMTALIRHLHAFTREVDLTEGEWAAAVEWLTATGRISDDKRQEFILASDVLGLSTLVVQMNHRFSAAATPATVLGPFHIDGSPSAAFGADMSDDVPGTPLFITGRVLDLDGAPLSDVLLDVWQADADGTYEAQLPEVDEARLRAKYRTRSDGTYCVRTIAPRGYAIPMDGPVGNLISGTDISCFRPAHIHFLVDHPGHEKLITHLFRQGSAFLDTDVVFGTKDELIVSFTERPAGDAPDGGTIAEPHLHAEFDFVLQARDEDPRP
ncbi:dioxygenase [Streptomyces sp. NPDC005811]|uniref:dioxygenase family protein n=1 Tax=Streptomyces sp. NPDC005811 TaxID=3154565 RepID=UPI0033F87A0A